LPHPFVLSLSKDSRNALTATATRAPAKAGAHLPNESLNALV